MRLPQVSDILFGSGAVPFQFPMLKSGDVQHVEESMHVCIHLPSISPKDISGYARCCAEICTRMQTSRVNNAGEQIIITGERRRPSRRAGRERPLRTSEQCLNWPGPDARCSGPLCSFYWAVSSSLANFNVLRVIFPNSNVNLSNSNVLPSIKLFNFSLSLRILMFE